MKLALQIVAGILFTPLALGLLYALVATVNYIATGTAWNPLGLDAGRSFAWLVLGSGCAGAGSFVFAEEIQL